MPKYNVEKTFWRHGLEVKAGDEVSLSKAEAKYLGHAVSAPKAVDDEPAPTSVEETPVLKAAAAVEELPARHAKRKRYDDSSN
jgi:hypothetical protein